MESNIPPGPRAMTAAELKKQIEDSIAAYVTYQTDKFLEVTGLQVSSVSLSFMPEHRLGAHVVHRLTSARIYI